MFQTNRLVHNVYNKGCLNARVELQITDNERKIWLTMPREVEIAYFWIFFVINFQSIYFVTFISVKYKLKNINYKNLNIYFNKCQSRKNKPRTYRQACIIEYYLVLSCHYKVDGKRGILKPAGREK